MIKECNFKHTTNYGKTKECKLTCHGEGCKKHNCSGEENCILFQIYANNSMVIKKEIADTNFNKIMETYGPAKYDVTIGGLKKPKKHTCINCGKKSNHSYSSGYCDDCYMEKFHSNVEKQNKRLEKWADKIAKRSRKII
jgi:hypothetical protein